EVTADRADDSTSVVYFLVTVPRGGSLDLSVNNGPISIRSVDGSVIAHAHNGPIAVKDSSGTLDITTVNGPISFAGESGTVKLRATNGPVSVKLAGSSWSGGSLDAATENGPMTLKLPRGYRSGVVVESDGNGPVTCRAEQCRDVRRFNEEGDDDRPRRIELGSGARAVTLSTNNGPLVVKEDWSDPQDLSTLRIRSLLQVLGLTFGLAVTVGNIIGAGILRTPGDIAAQLPTFWPFISVWIIGGLYALLGANALAELGTRVPRSGGQYVFVREALGDYAGLVVGWSDWVSTCGTTAAVSIVIGEYAIVLFPRLHAVEVVALVTIASLTLVQWVGVKWGGLA